MKVLRRFTPVVHRIDHALGRLSPQRDVLVELRTPVYHAVLAPVAGELETLPGVRIWFTSETPERLRPLVPTRRQVYAQVPPKVEYSLTKLGRTLIEPLHALCRWSEKHLPELQANRARAKQAVPQG